MPCGLLCLVFQQEVVGFVRRTMYTQNATIVSVGVVRRVVWINVVFVTVSTVRFAW